MVYALNPFNPVPGENDYRAVGGRVENAGSGPIRRLHDDRERRHMIVVEFPNEDAFQQFLDEAERPGIHQLRESSTTDYIWTLYEPWDLASWVSQRTVGGSVTG